MNFLLQTPQVRSVHFAPLFCSHTSRQLYTVATLPSLFDLFLDTAGTVSFDEFCCPIFAPKDNRITKTFLCIEASVLVFAANFLNRRLSLFGARSDACLNYHHAKPKHTIILIYLSSTTTSSTPRHNTNLIPAHHTCV